MGVGGCFDSACHDSLECAMDYNGYVSRMVAMDLIKQVSSHFNGLDRLVYTAFFLSFFLLLRRG